MAKFNLYSEGNSSKRNYKHSSKKNYDHEDFSNFAYMSRGNVKNELRQIKESYGY